MVFTVIGIVWVMMYARKVKKNPTGSITYHDDIAKREEFAVDSMDADMPFTLRQKLVLICRWHGRHRMGPCDKGLVHG